MSSWPASIWFRTTVSLIAVDLFAILLIWTQVYLGLWNIITPEQDQRHRILPQLANAIEGVLTVSKTGQMELPPTLLSELAAENIVFTVLDGKGRFLIGSEGHVDAIKPTATFRFKEFFVRAATATEPALYGFSSHRLFGPNGYTIQVATSDGPRFFSSLILIIFRRLTWTSILVLIILIGANILSLRWALRPLRRAAEDATGIGPQNTSKRLPELNIPREILPLVQAVNLVLERLADGYRAQREFIADAAHELRTPLAVLKAHLDVLDDRQTAQSLEGDLAGMERLVSQLLAMARLDSIHVGADDLIDLTDLTVDVARYISPSAAKKGQRIEVIGVEHKIEVRGTHDSLFRALRNLVENALRHSPPESTITLLLTAAPPVVSVLDQGPGVPAELRDIIFKRFWHGQRDRAQDEGVGLGLAIVAATMKVHQGSVDITDAPDGGAAFNLRFPEIKAPLPGGGHAADAALFQYLQ